MDEKHYDGQYWPKHVVFYHLLINKIYIVVFLTVITLSMNYYTQRGWRFLELLGKEVFVIENKILTKIFGIKEDE